MSTFNFRNQISFTYTVIKESNPTILRGDFYRGTGVEKLGIALEINRPTHEEAVESIHNCAKLIAAGIE